MNIFLGAIQAILAIVFSVSGFHKLVRTKEQLVAQMGALEDLSPTQIRMIGWAEVAGSLGLVLPWLTRTLPGLSSLAALGLVLVMVMASVTHYRRKEYPMIALTSVLLFLSLMIAVGRVSILPR